MSLFKKNKSKTQDVDLFAEDSSGTEQSAESIAADVDAVMKQYDRESNTRIWEGVPKYVVMAIAAAFSIFCIVFTMFITVDDRVRLTSFLACGLFIGYILYPAKKGVQKVNHIPWYDIIIMIAGTAAFMYFCINSESIIDRRFYGMTIPEIAIGIVGIIAVMELCRRSVGVPILIVAGAFMAYAWYYFSFAAPVPMGAFNGLLQVVYNLFYTTTGLLTTPIDVCSKYIVVFIIFGAFLERTGISTYFISLANSVAGSSAGGPAKVAVLSSALCGMVSGSSVGNTVTTGSVTIPMMKRTGYKPEFAGAVEATSSTGGQIMPPIMGAAAFLMIDFLGQPYSKIIVYAIIPAILYFAGIYVAVHLEAKKVGLKGIPRSELPSFWKLQRSIYLLIPLVVLVVLVSTNTYTMAFSASVAIVLAIFVGLFEICRTTIKAPAPAEGSKGGVIVKETGFMIFNSLANGGKSCISIIAACAMAGCVAGSITMTGLGSQLIGAVTGLAGNVKFVALFLTMLCCIVLGMGVPTTANFCIMATTCAPILIDPAIGIDPVAAYFFVFYFGIVADITPPVALAAYAGSAIAKSNPMKTALTATRLAIAAFIVPYVFAYSPSLLLVDTTVPEAIQVAITSMIGIFGVATALCGHLYKKVNWFFRFLLAAGGLTLIIPGTLTDIIGIVLVGGVVVYQKLSSKSAQTPKAA